MQGKGNFFASNVELITTPKENTKINPYLTKREQTGNYESIGQEASVLNIRGKILFVSVSLRSFLKVSLLAST